MEKSFSSKIGVLLAAAGSAVAMAKTVKLERINDGEMEGMITLEAIDIKISGLFCIVGNM